MTGQLSIFTALTAAANAAQPTNDPDTPAAGPAAAPRTGQPHDHAGQPGDDGSLHYMLTGQPEPARGVVKW